MIIDAINQGGDPGTIIGIALLAWINGFAIASFILRK